MAKISAEVRVGIISILIIAVFIWLFSFLKGNNLFKSTDTYYVYYNEIGGLEETSPVEINGLKAGVVDKVSLVNDGSGTIEVIINIRKGYNIPDNSVAVITTETLIAGMKVDLQTGNSSSFHIPGDTLKGRLAVSALDKIDREIDPMLESTAKLILRLDSLTGSMNSVFTREFGNDLKEGVSKLNSSATSLESVLTKNKNEIDAIISQLDIVTGTFAKNSGRIDSSLSNLSSVSSTLAGSGLDSVLIDFKHSLNNSKEILEGLNSGQGSAGKFLKDDSLYLNLSNSISSLESLLSDIEKHPGKYINISVFGKKNK